MAFQAINENTYVFEDGHVRFFLLVGDKEALLIDSGLNTPNAKELAEEVTDKPIRLFNTHADRDYISGNEAFEEVLMNPAEFVAYTMPHPYQKMVAIYDGDMLDLGNRPLQAIALPGHTPGSTAILDCNTGMLFSGDPIQRNGHVALFGPMRDITAYILSMERLLQRKDDITAIYPSHGDCPIPFDVLPELIAGAKQVADGQLTPTITEFYGKPVAEYDVGVAVLLCNF